jgi:hypothetical protein
MDNDLAIMRAEYMAVLKARENRIAALEDALRALVNFDFGTSGGYVDYTPGSGCYNSATKGYHSRLSCTYCLGRWWSDEPERHESDCPVTIARTLLGE